MGEYRIPYEGKVYRYRDKHIGDRGIVDAAEKKALAIVCNLMKQGKTGIKYEEHVTAETPTRQGFISVTW
jgi:hypothetical protein